MVMSRVGSYFLKTSRPVEYIIIEAFRKRERRLRL